MKYIRRKVSNGNAYFYFQFPLKVGRRRAVYTRYLGTKLPNDLKLRVVAYFKEVATITDQQLGLRAKKFFLPKPTLPIEQSRYWYQGMHHDLFKNDLKLFRDLFAVLFLLNSNRSEGSQMTRDNLESALEKTGKPKSRAEREAMNSIRALNFAFSKDMKWNLKSIKKVHALLLDGIAVDIAGKFKKGNNIVDNMETTAWEEVQGELSKLLKWFLGKKGKVYPPELALRFHYRFEKIHPFADGNGRVGRLLLNAYLLQEAYMPVVFFSKNHKAYNTAIGQAIDGRNGKLARYFVEQVKKTRSAVERYKHEGVLKGGSKKVGQWEIERGKIRKF